MPIQDQIQGPIGPDLGYRKDQNQGTVRTSQGLSRTRVSHMSTVSRVTPPPRPCTWDHMFTVPRVTISLILLGVKYLNSPE